MKESRRRALESNENDGEAIASVLVKAAHILQSTHAPELVTVVRGHAGLRKCTRVSWRVQLQASGATSSRSMQRLGPLLAELGRWSEAVDVLKTVREHSGVVIGRWRNRSSFTAGA